MTNLTGTEKQRAWATKIKTALQADFDKFKELLADNLAAINGIEFIEGIKAAEFWIDYKSFSAQDLLEFFAGENGLDYKGRSYNDNAKIDLEGKINFTK